MCINRVKGSQAFVEEERQLALLDIDIDSRASIRGVTCSTKFTSCNPSAEYNPSSIVHYVRYKSSPYIHTNNHQPANLHVKGSNAFEAINVETSLGTFYYFQMRKIFRIFVVFSISSP